MLKIKNILPFIIQIILIIPISELAAQPLTLDSCKAFALRHNVTVQNALLDVQAAEQVKKQAFTKYFPSVSATALGYHAINPLLELGIDDIDNAQARNYLYDLYAEYGSAMGLPNSVDFCEHGLSVGATLMQPVFAGGRIDHSLTRKVKRTAGNDILAILKSRPTLPFANDEGRSPGF